MDIGISYLKVAAGLCLLVGVLTMTACGDVAAPPTTSIAEARSDKERIADPQVSEADLTELVRGNNAFALDLYRQLSERDGNLFLSPYSISSALAMTYAGARGETEGEMAAALSFVLPQDRLHPAFNVLDRALAAGPEFTTQESSDPLDISIANSLWGERTYEFLPDFLDTLAESYGAGLRLVDFINDFEGARRAINAWVSEQTEERIPELLEEGTLDELTRLVLTNAIYFKASWLFPFDPAETRDGPFHLLDGSEVQTSMMHLDERTGYGEMDGVQVVRLPYEGLNYAMYLVLPPEGEFATFEASLDAERMEALIDSVGDAQVELTMPKFEFDSSFDLPESLGELGMVSPFDPDVADLSGMDGTRDLYISEVVHKAFVAVDEEGTEAAAATGVVGSILSGPPIAVSVVVDRPFLFAISHVDTGATLFLGRVLDPTA